MSGVPETSKPTASESRERPHGKEKRHKRGFSFAAKLTGSSHDRWVFFKGIRLSVLNFPVQGTE